MGMMMVSPMTISLPFKLLIFYCKCGGWDLTLAIGTELFMNDSELTQFITQLYGSSFYVYAGSVGGIGSWCSS